MADWIDSNPGKFLLICTIIVVAAMIQGLIQLSLWSSEVSCINQWKDSGIAYQWDWRAGCRISVDGKWIPDKAYIVNRLSNH